MRTRYIKFWAILLILSICSDQFVISKRSGGYGRGSSSSRSSRGFSSGLGSRFSSSRGYGGSNSGGRKWTDRLFGRNRGTSTGAGVMGGNKGRGILGGTGGGIFGHGSRSNYGAGRSGKGGFLGGLGGSRGGGLMGGRGYRTSMFRNSGIGSRSRGHTFRNMLFGAAAGILAYQAGKAIIRNVARPMMWNNRQYYWGPQYYPQQLAYGAAPSKTMCRMAIDPNDPVLGQVYLQDQTRPKEIVWSCELHEECCGYECCPRGTAGAGGYGHNSNIGDYDHSNSDGY